MYTLADYQRYARKYMDRQVFQYFENGADQEITLKLSADIFSHLFFVPRVLVDVSALTLRHKILGKQVALPFGFAPTAMQRLAHPEGQLVTARASHRFKIPLAISMLSTTTLQDITRQNPDGPKFLQLYIPKNKQVPILLAKAAELNKFEGLVITVDTQVLGNRLKQRRNKFVGNVKQPLIDSLEGAKSRQYLWLQRDTSLNWDFINWLRGQTSLKIILKGVLHPLDVLRAAEARVDAVWLSNHGGRQLDTTVPALLMLKQARRILVKHGHSLQLFVDGGIRRGSDIAKCYALGADFVFIGRPILWGIFQGDEGIEGTCQILQEQLRRSMQLLGVRSVSELRESEVRVICDSKL